MKLFIGILAFAMSTQAVIQSSRNKVAPFELKNYSLEKFLAQSANALDQRITVDASVRESLLGDSLTLDVNNSLDKENFEEILRSVLRSFGYTLLQDNSGLTLINSRDLRYMPSPVVLAEDLKKGGEAYTMAVFKTKYPVANVISRNLRPFLSRYARVVSLSDARHLLINDTKENIISLKELIATMDTETTYKTALENMREKALKKVEDVPPAVPKELLQKSKRREK